MSVEISREQWLKALDEAQPKVEDDPTLLTVLELCEVFGLGRTAMRERVKLMVKAGTAIKSSKWIVDVTGRRQRASAYRLVKKS